MLLFEAAFKLLLSKALKRNLCEELDAYDFRRKGEGMRILTFSSKWSGVALDFLRVNSVPLYCQDKRGMLNNFTSRSDADSYRKMREMMPKVKLQSASIRKCMQSCTVTSEALSDPFKSNLGYGFQRLLAVYSEFASAMIQLPLFLVGAQPEQYPTNLQVNGCFQKQGAGFCLGLGFRAVSKQVIYGDTGVIPWLSGNISTPRTYLCIQTLNS